MLSPDIFILVFIVFCFVKEKMLYALFQNPEELKDNIYEILDEIGPEFLNKLFKDWEERLKEVIRINAEYIH